MLTGGDINDAFRLKTTSGDFALKVNSARKFPNLFQKEANGLALLAATETFKIPQVKCVGKSNEYTYLLMEFIDAEEKVPDFWSLFAENLAKLHRFSAKNFGLAENNYLGSLPQQNDGNYSNAADFYIEKRLIPQFKLAKQKGYDFKTNALFKTLSEEIPYEPPALIHGDLWNGNYMTSVEGTPCLIDPAVAYAPREIDLAIMKLFGGFPEEVFKTYNNLFPLATGWEKRVKIWQLYHLLFHLNVFGSSYYESVQAIVKNPFS